MKRVVLVSVGFLASTLLAEPVCESELARGESSAVTLDLRAVWQVSASGQLPISNISYSSVGWDIEEGDAGSEVRLSTMPCTELSDGSFDVETALREDVGEALTGRGTTTWSLTPDHRLYRLVHRVFTTSTGMLGSEKELTATFDFRPLATPATDAEALAAMRTDYSLAMEFANDPTLPWTVAADGGLTTAGSSAIALSFAGGGTLSFDYFLAGGSLAVTVDGVAAEVSQQTGGWQTFTTDVTAWYSAHTVEIAYAGTDGVTVRACSLTQMSGAVVASGVSSETPIDLSSVWQVESLQSDLLKGISYSAVGWDLSPVEAGSTVRLFAAPAAGGDEIAIASGLTGRGTVDWALAAAQKVVYTVTHEVTLTGAKVDANAFLSASYDFSGCKMAATHPEIVRAVTDIGHALTVTDDADDPWQPIGGDGSGVAATAPTVDGKTATTLAFDFVGKGTLSWQYALDAGALNVMTDGVPVRAYAATEGWTADSLDFGYGAHTAVFSFAGETGAARLKSVVWREAAEEDRATTASDPFAADLRPGVRYVRYRSELLPFAFSHTNWVGDVTADTNAVVRVDIVRLAGEGGDCTQWEPVDGTEKNLFEGCGEGTVSWRGHGGVWKATMQIKAKKVDHAQEAYFDMRDFGLGLSVIVR